MPRLKSSTFISSDWIIHVPLISAYSVSIVKGHSRRRGNEVLDAITRAPLPTLNERPLPKEGERGWLACRTMKIVPQ